MTKLAELDDVQPLEGGWVNLTEAAELLGWTRSYMYKKAAKPVDAGRFRTLRKIGHQASYVINLEEINEILARQTEDLKAATSASDAAPPAAKKPAEKKAPARKKEAPAPVQEAAEPVEEERVLSLDEVLQKI